MTVMTATRNITLTLAPISPFLIRVSLESALPVETVAVALTLLLLLVVLVVEIVISFVDVAVWKPMIFLDDVPYSKMITKLMMIV